MVLPMKYNEAPQVKGVTNTVSHKKEEGKWKSGKRDISTCRLYYKCFKSCNRYNYRYKNR